MTPTGGKAISIVGYDKQSAEFAFANDWGDGWRAKWFGKLKGTDLTQVWARLTRSSFEAMRVAALKRPAPLHCRVTVPGDVNSIVQRPTSWV